MTIEQYVKAMWDRGLFSWLTSTFGFDEKQRLEFVESSRADARKHPPPPFFPGFIDMLTRFKQQGGVVAVVSFGEKNAITENYRTAGAPFPDHIFGWTKETAQQCKPFPYPVHFLCEKSGFSPSEVLVVDDMKPGLAMGRAAGALTVGAIYAERHHILRDSIAPCCDVVCDSVADLARLLLGDDAPTP